MSTHELSEILHSLQREHVEISTLVNRLQDQLLDLLNHSNGLASIQDIIDSFDILANDLQLHITEEEQFLFPCCKKILDAESLEEKEEREFRRLIGGMNYQHQNYENDITIVLEDLDIIPMQDDWELKAVETRDNFADFRLLLQQHSHHEHDKLFPKVLRLIDEKTLN